jgi:hypothetical protein
MKMKILRRKPASIAKTRWAAYAAAGAATAFAGTNSAEAAIHYSGILNVRFPPHKHTAQRFHLDQKGDYLFFGHDFGYPNAFFSVTGIVSAAFRGISGSGFTPYLAKLGFGQKISSGYFNSYFHLGVLQSFSYGSWPFPGIGYIGFRFNNGAGTQYGWARLKDTTGKPENGFGLEAYAYADPGEPIVAGQRSSVEETPDEGSLGWLAAGAVGLLAWRKSRSRAVSVRRPRFPA